MRFAASAHALLIWDSARNSTVFRKAHIFRTPKATAAGASDQTVDGGMFAGWCKTLLMEDLEELHVGLFPELSKTANTVSTESKTLDMVLLANPAEAEAQSLRVSEFATDAFCAASLLQLTAARYRIAAAPVQAMRAALWPSPRASISGCSSACRQTPRQ